MSYETTDAPALDARSFELPDLQALVEEPLLPELEPYLRYDEELGLGLHHPLVVQPIAVVNGLANRLYQSKTADLSEAIAQEDWERVSFIYERPYRIEAFIEHALNGECTALADLSPELRRIVTSIWMDSENHYEMREHWNQLFAKRDGTLLLSDTQGQELFDSLPDVLTAYRGDHADSLRISWSLDQATGKFFARRFSGSSRALLVGTVKKEHIYGVITERGETEILVDMHHVENIR